jgi:hypothetical protein
MFAPRRIFTDAGLRNVLNYILNDMLMHKASQLKCFKASDISVRYLVRISDRTLAILTVFLCFSLLFQENSGIMP